MSEAERVIPLSTPEFGGNEWKYLRECLDTAWVSSVGPFVDRFEQEVAAYVGARHAVAVINGTAALQIALLVVGVKENDEVLVSDLTFIAPVNAIRYCRAHPVLFDANPQTWQMDVEKVARFLNEECEMRRTGCYNKTTGRRVRAVLPVHILGLACEMDRIMELARRHDLRVVEDAAEAMGVRYKDRHPGTFADVGVLSFNGNKIITAGGGGMVVTDDASYAEQARYLTTQAKDDALEYIHKEVGYNYRLSNLQAALGVAQLEQIEGFIARKRAIARIYQEALQELDGVTLMPSPSHTRSTYWLYTILLSKGTTLAARKKVVRRLNDSGIGTRPLWHTIHDLPPYQSCQAYRITHSVDLYERGVSLPSSVGVKAREQQRCIEALKRAIGT